MTAKDITEKELEAKNDVFADIMNNLLFGGVEYVKEDELEQGRQRSSYSSDSKHIREQERDLSKFWKQNEIRLAYVGIENETEPEDDMPFRNIGYDGASYRDQISYVVDGKGKRRKVIERYPVVTLVLYMGYRKRWDKAKSIHEALGDRLDERLKPFVHDYPINLFEIAFITDEQLDKFKSDFWIVADYLVQMRKNNSYIPSDRQMRHVREVLNLMAAMTNDTRFVEVVSESEKGDEPKNMCEVLDRVENRGIDKGRREGKEEGRKEGREEGQRNTAALMAFLVKNGRPDDVVRASSDESFLKQLLSDFGAGLLSPTK